jgi:hypothetical protein
VVKLIDQPDYCRISFFQKERDNILQALSDLGRDVGVGTKLHGTTLVERLAEARREREQGAKGKEKTDPNQTSILSERQVSDYLPRTILLNFQSSDPLLPLPSNPPNPIRGSHLSPQGITPRINTMALSQVCMMSHSLFLSKTG